MEDTCHGRFCSANASKSRQNLHQVGSKNAQRAIFGASVLDVAARNSRAQGRKYEDPARAEVAGGMDELSSRGIPYEVTQAVLERTWKVVQEQVGVGSALQGLKTKVWRSRNATQQCSSCGIYVSDKGVHGAYRCRGARNTTSKFTGQCCNCRFSVDVTNKAENQISARHSCQACKAWRRGEQITQNEMEVESTTLVVHGILGTLF